MDKELDAFSKLEGICKALPSLTKEDRVVVIAMNLPVRGSGGEARQR